MADDMNPVGYKRVIIEPSRSGIGEAIFLNVAEEVNGLPAQNPDTGVFVPRTEQEKTNVLNAINEKRKSLGLSDVTTEIFDYNNNRFVEYSNARFAAAQEGQKRERRQGRERNWCEDVAWRRHDAGPKLSPAAWRILCLQPSAVQSAAPSACELPRVHAIQKWPTSTIPECVPPIPTGRIPARQLA